jgi:hypothetical protein
MSKEISRRELLKMMGFGAAGIALGGCTTKREGDPAAITEQPTATPEANKIVIEEVILTNVPKEVDSNIVDIAKGEFENKTDVAPHIFANPGGLLVGPDFGYGGKENPWGNNPGGWKTMYESGGSIQVISPVNQEVIR